MFSLFYRGICKCKYLNEKISSHFGFQCTVSPMVAIKSCKHVHVMTLTLARRFDLDTKKDQYSSCFTCALSILSHYKALFHPTQSLNFKWIITNSWKIWFCILKKREIEIIDLSILDYSLIWHLMAQYRFNLSCMPLFPFSSQ